MQISYWRQAVRKVRSQRKTHCSCPQGALAQWRRELWTLRRFIWNAQQRWKRVLSEAADKAVKYKPRRAMYLNRKTLTNWNKVGSPRELESILFPHPHGFIFCCLLSFWGQDFSWGSKEKRVKHCAGTELAFSNYVSPSGEPQDWAKLVGLMAAGSCTIPHLKHHFLGNWHFSWRSKFVSRTQDSTG